MPRVNPPVTPSGSKPPLADPTSTGATSSTPGPSTAAQAVVASRPKAAATEAPAAGRSGKLPASAADRRVAAQAQHLPAPRAIPQDLGELMQLRPGALGQAGGELPPTQSHHEAGRDLHFILALLDDHVRTGPRWTPKPSIPVPTLARGRFPDSPMLESLRAALDARPVPLETMDAQAVKKSNAAANSGIALLHKLPEQINERSALLEKSVHEVESRHRLLESAFVSGGGRGFDPTAKDAEVDVLYKAARGQIKAWAQQLAQQAARLATLPDNPNTVPKDGTQTSRARLRDTLIAAHAALNAMTLDIEIADSKRPAKLENAVMSASHEDAPPELVDRINRRVADEAEHIARVEAWSRVAAIEQAMAVEALLPEAFRTPSRLPYAASALMYITINVMSKAEVVASIGTVDVPVDRLQEDARKTMERAVAVIDELPDADLPWVAQFVEELNKIHRVGWDLRSALNTESAARAPSPARLGRISAALLALVNNSGHLLDSLHEVVGAMPHGPPADLMERVRELEHDMAYVQAADRIIAEAVVLAYPPEAAPAPVEPAASGASSPASPVGATHDWEGALQQARSAVSEALQAPPDPALARVPTFLQADDLYRQTLAEVDEAMTQAAIQLQAHFDRQPGLGGGQVELATALMTAGDALEQIKAHRQTAAAANRRFPTLDEAIDASVDCTKAFHDLLTSYAASPESHRLTEAGLDARADAGELRYTVPRHGGATQTKISSKKLLVEYLAHQRPLKVDGEKFQRKPLVVHGHLQPDETYPGPAQLRPGQLIQPDPQVRGSLDANSVKAFAHRFSHLDDQGQRVPRLPVSPTFVVNAGRRAKGLAPLE